MKLVQSSGGSFVFEFRSRERQLLAAILDLYPLLNPDYHQASRTASPDEIAETESLLRDAMTEQQAKNKRMVADFMDEKNWPSTEDGRHRLSFSAEKVEWLLQVLNDVRVGSWVRLGKPDSDRGEKLNVTLENMPYAGALEFTGYFQMVLLQAMES